MKDGARWKVLILPSARRQLLRLGGATLDQIRQAIRRLADDPTPGDSLAMVGKATGLHRLRVGSHRVVYRIQDDQLIVLVIRIGHRSDVYKGFQGK